MFPYLFLFPNYTVLQHIYIYSSECIDIIKFSWILIKWYIDWDSVRHIFPSSLFSSFSSSWCYIKHVSLEGWHMGVCMMMCKAHFIAYMCMTQGRLWDIYKGHPCKFINQHIFCLRLPAYHKGRQLVQLVFTLLRHKHGK